MAHHLYYSRNSTIANDDPGTKIDFMKDETIIFEGGTSTSFSEGDHL